MPSVRIDDSKLLAGRTLTLTLFSFYLLANQACCAQPVESDSAPAVAQAEALFELPEKLENVDQLADFVEKLSELEPEGRSEQAHLAHQKKVARSVVAAAEKYLSPQLNSEDAMQTVFYQLQGLRMLSNLGDAQADAALAKAIEAAQADKRADVQAVGLKFMVEAGFASWTDWDDQEKAALIEKIANFLTSRPAEGNHVNLTMTVVDFLGDMNGEKHAQQLLAKMIPHFQSSDDADIKQALPLLLGVQRRMNLPGKEIELSGTMLDGSKLDWKSYRGKVVLVDFWATWCGPCRAEVPNVLKAYKAYHEKGFEVLGISLDELPDQAKSYIEQTNIPWPTLFSNDPTERRWRHPMAVRYGITGIPRAILVDRDGKVVHMTARGEVLGRELRRLLGEPVAKVENRGNSFVRQASASTVSN